MRIAVVGAGSIGAAVGARLAATGHDVVLIARGAHLDAIRANGLTLVDHVSALGGTYRLAASDRPADFGVQDIVLIGLKAHSIAAMLPTMAALVGPQTTVVPMINGMPWWYFHREGGPHDGMALRTLDPDGRMFAALDPARILGCVVHIAADVRAPGEVHHTGGRRIAVGEPDRTMSARLAQVADALDAAGFDTERAPDIRMTMWVKLIGNVSFNPVAALTGYLMNQIIDDEGLLDVIRAVMREGMAVAAHYGYPIAMSVDERIGLARQLGAARISMLQDLEQRRPLELAAIVGAVIELAELADISMPATRHLHALTAARAKALGIAQGG